jgi:hypothetical protein
VNSRRCDQESVDRRKFSTRRATFSGHSSPLARDFVVDRQQPADKVARQVLSNPVLKLVSPLSTLR